MAHTILFQQLRRTLHKAYCQNLQNDRVNATIETSKYRRRKFLKMSTLAASAALSTTTFSRLKAARSNSTEPKIAIVGGGIAGLNAAYQLKKVGLIATVYEAKTRLGGRIHTVTGVAGSELASDLGGLFINSDHRDILGLVEEFNLSLFNRIEAAQNLPFPSEGYYFAGKWYSEAEVAEQLRPIARQIVDDASLLERDFDRYAPQIDRLSVAQYLERHLEQTTAPMVRQLLENTIRTEYGVEPEKASALQLIYNLTTVEGDRVTILGGSDETYVVEGGSSQIIDALVAALPQQIQTKKHLIEIKSDGNSYRLRFSDFTAVNADYVIIAIPISMLRRLILNVKVEALFQRFIREVNLGVNEKVFAGFKKRIWQQERGFTTNCWCDLGFSQVWDGTNRQPTQQNAALTFFLGGNQVKSAYTQTLSSLANTFLQDFEQIIPQARSWTIGKFFRTYWSRDYLVGGSYTNFQPGQYTEFSKFLYVESEVPEERQDVSFGNLVFAGEHLSDEFYGYMNGAAQTGRLAAEVVAIKIRLAHRSSFKN
jgi:monoamine oxidase